mmetsp:Transcript_15492/g.54293  ORF Transcript_15492/g.54293 Transcript_15492/m.54293 type:complete len:188 (+) Transcript_15492:329-892(+)
MIRQKIKREPFIQLSQYSDFTDAIVSICKDWYEPAVDSLRQDVEALAERLVEIDSPWLETKPHLTKSAEGEASSKVDVSCNIQGFLDALVSQVLRKIPSPNKLGSLADGVTVGTEKQVVVRKCKELKEELKRIQDARDGICRAFSISMDELAAMQGGLAAEVTVAPAAGIAASSAPQPLVTDQATAQ